jgi:hypothetical protein
MKTRLIRIKDTWTDFFCVLTQFESVDKDFCDKIGIGTDYKILNGFEGSNVCTFAGYLSDNFFENKVCSRSFEGTYKAIGNILRSIGNEIKYLPETLDVEKTRNFFNDINSDYLGLRGFINGLSDDYAWDEIRKRKTTIQDGFQIELCIEDESGWKCVYSRDFTKSQYEIERAIIIYLWLPYEEC